ncbi:MAG: glycosyltransferase [Elusimicrobia bacterium]|nr:glycosyltransferase [Elusimicrobiota bacterium]
MKLLLVPDPTSPHSEDAFCRELSVRAAKRGHETRIHTVPNGPLEATVEQLSATGFGLASDLVFVNSLQPAAIAAAGAAGRKIAVRFIDSFSGASAEAVAEVQSLLSKADLVMVPSRYLEQVVRGWGVTAPIAQVPYAYDQIRAQEITLVTMRASRPTGFPLVAVGLISEDRLPCYDFLLAALARLRLDWHLTLIGGGPARPALQARVDQISLADRVVFSDPLPHEKVMEYLRAAKAYVDPCGLEGFPMLALYAQSEGCPVIAARRGAYEEFIVDGENGLLFPPGDSTALSEAVVTLASVPGLSLKLIAAGIKTVEERSWDLTVDKAFAAFENLMSDDTASRPFDHSPPRGGGE